VTRCRHLRVRIWRKRSHHLILATSRRTICSRRAPPPGMSLPKEVKANDRRQLPPQQQHKRQKADPRTMNKQQRRMFDRNNERRLGGKQDPGKELKKGGHRYLIFYADVQYAECLGGLFEHVPLPLSADGRIHEDRGPWEADAQVQRGRQYLRLHFFNAVWRLWNKPHGRGHGHFLRQRLQPSATESGRRAKST